MRLVQAAILSFALVAAANLAAAQSKSVVAWRVAEDGRVVLALPA